MAHPNRGLSPSLGRYASAISRIPIEKNADRIMWTQLNGHDYAARMGLTKYLISAVIGNRPTTRY